MENKIKINAIFKSVQGEGRFAGYPMLFIRVSGCNRNCSYCDTKYHVKGKDMTLKEIKKEIVKSKMNIICFTGGEPLLYKEQIIKIYNEDGTDRQYHIETNGDFLDEAVAEEFDYVACSPKDLKTAKQAKKLLKYRREEADIKVVTDLKSIGIDMLKYATRLMPLTTFDEKKDLAISKKVWNYCTENKIIFSPRLHINVWGAKRKI